MLLPIKPMSIPAQHKVLLSHPNSLLTGQVHHYILGYFALQGEEGGERVVHRELHMVDHKPLRNVVYLTHSFVVQVLQTIPIHVVGWGNKILALDLALVRLIWQVFGLPDVS